jgi:very-short-patch-repair endonuclease
MGEKPRFGVWRVKKIPAAQRLRRDLTDAERLLWSRLRSRALHGWKFRRQHPIGAYIADFACLEGGLVVELDGGQHADAAAYDSVRTRVLERGRFRVLRFWNNDVLTNIEGVLQSIAGGLPSPASAGEGGDPSRSDGEGEGQRTAPGSAQSDAPHPGPLPQGGRGRIGR